MVCEKKKILLVNIENNKSFTPLLVATHNVEMKAGFLKLQSEDSVFYESTQEFKYLNIFPNYRNKKS